MISENTRNSYSEVFELLSHIDRQDLSKIPINLLETIKENRNKSYKPQIAFDNLDKSLSKKSRALYTWLYITYMAEDKEKDRITDILKKNEMEQRNNLIFDNTTTYKFNNNIAINEDKQGINLELVSYKPSIFQSFINKIKNIFNGGK